jgi:hypothetical protein
MNPCLISHNICKFASIMGDMVKYLHDCSVAGCNDLAAHHIKSGPRAVPRCRPPDAASSDKSTSIELVLLIPAWPPYAKPQLPWHWRA